MLQYSKSIGRRHSSDDAGDSLHAGLVIKTTSTASPDKYKRLWRYGFCVVRVVLTLNKKPPSSTPPPPIYVSVPPTTANEISRSSSSQCVINVRCEEEERERPPSFGRLSSSPSQIDSDDDQEEEEEEERAISSNGAVLITSPAAAASPDKYKRLWLQSMVGVLPTLDKKPSSPPISVSFPPTTADEVVIGISSPSREGLSSSLSQIPNEAVQDQQRRLDRIVKDKDFNSLRAFVGDGRGGPEQLADLFNSHLDRGLNVRVDPNPTNATDPVRTRQLVGYLVKAGNNSTILLLSISAALSLLTEMLEQGPEQGWHDGVAILAAVVLLVTFPAAAEFLRARKMEAEEEDAARVEVVRGGQPQMVPVSGVTVGDVVELKEGDRVPGDGLFVGSGTGELMLNDELASSVNWDQNPFLSAGFKVLEGNGRMLVTSVGTDTAIGKVMSMVKADPQERTLLLSRIDGPNSFADKIPLCISILITLVLFIRFLHANHGDNDNGLPELKGEVPVESLIKLFERKLLRPRGLVCILTTILTSVVLGLQHGMSLAITVSLLHWNQKVASGHAKPRTLSACGTMGIATVICLDISGGIMYNQMEVEKVLVGVEEINTEEESNISQVVLEPSRQEILISTLMPEDEPLRQIQEETKSAIMSLKEQGLNILLVTGDELGKAKAFALALGINSPGSDDVALIGEDFRGLGNSNPREQMKRTTVIGKCHPKDKLCVVQLLKELGHVVVVYGASSPADAAALKEADVGITVEVQGAEMAIECCDIVITKGGGLLSLTTLLKHGRCVCHNLQKFIELQLTVSISGVLISAVSTMSLGESPLTALQLLWANLVVCVLGGMMMVMEPPNGEQSAHQPRPTRAKSFMTMVMWRNLTVQILYQSFVGLILQFEGQEMNGMDKSKTTTMIFNTFILCQVFNLFNAMGLEKKEVFLYVIQSSCFLASVGGILVAQLLVVHLATSLALAGYVRLNWVQWAFCFLFSGSSWGFDWVLKFTWVFLGKLSHWLASSRILEFSVSNGRATKERRPIVVLRIKSN